MQASVDQLLQMYGASQAENVLLKAESRNQQQEIDRLNAVIKRLTEAAGETSNEANKQGG